MMSNSSENSAVGPIIFFVGFTALVSFGTWIISRQHYEQRDRQEEQRLQRVIDLQETQISAYRSALELEKKGKTDECLERLQVAIDKLNKKLDQRKQAPKKQD